MIGGAFSHRLCRHTHIHSRTTSTSVRFFHELQTQNSFADRDDFLISSSRDSSFSFPPPSSSRLSSFALQPPMTQAQTQAQAQSQTLIPTLTSKHCEEQLTDEYILADIDHRNSGNTGDKENNTTDGHNKNDNSNPPYSESVTAQHKNSKQFVDQALSHILVHGLPSLSSRELDVVLSHSYLLFSALTIHLVKSHPSPSSQAFTYALEACKRLQPKTMRGSEARALMMMINMQMRANSASSSSSSTNSSTSSSAGAAALVTMEHYELCSEIYLSSANALRRHNNNNNNSNDNNTSPRVDSDVDDANVFSYRRSLAKWAWSLWCDFRKYYLYKFKFIANPNPPPSSSSSSSSASASSSSSSSSFSSSAPPFFPFLSNMSRVFELSESWSPLDAVVKFYHGVVQECKQSNRRITSESFCSAIRSLCLSELRLYALRDNSLSSSSASSPSSFSPSSLTLDSVYSSLLVDFFNDSADRYQFNTFLNDDSAVSGCQSSSSSSTTTDSSSSTMPATIPSSQYHARRSSLYSYIKTYIPTALPCLSMNVDEVESTTTTTSSSTTTTTKTTKIRKMTTQDADINLIEYTNTFASALLFAFRMQDHETVCTLYSQVKTHVTKYLSRDRSTDVHDPLEPYTALSSLCDFPFFSSSRVFSYYLFSLLHFDRVHDACLALSWCLSQRRRAATYVLPQQGVLMMTLRAALREVALGEQKEEEEEEREQGERGRDVCELLVTLIDDSKNSLRRELEQKSRKGELNRKVKSKRSVVSSGDKNNNVNKGQDLLSLLVYYTLADAAEVWNHVFSLALHYHQQLHHHHNHANHRRRLLLSHHLLPFLLRKLHDTESYTRTSVRLSPTVVMQLRSAFSVRVRLLKKGEGEGKREGSAESALRGRRRTWRRSMNEKSECDSSHTKNRDINANNNKSNVVNSDHPFHYRTSINPSMLPFLFSFMKRLVQTSSTTSSSSSSTLSSTLSAAVDIRDSKSDLTAFMSTMFTYLPVERMIDMIEVMFQHHVHERALVSTDSVGAVDGGVAVEHDAHDLHFPLHDHRAHDASLTVMSDEIDELPLFLLPFINTCLRRLFVSNFKQRHLHRRSSTSSSSSSSSLLSRWLDDSPCLRLLRDSRFCHHHLHHQQQQQLGASRRHHYCHRHHARELDVHVASWQAFREMDATMKMKDVERRMLRQRNSMTEMECSSFISYFFAPRLSTFPLRSSLLRSSHSPLSSSLSSSASLLSPLLRSPSSSSPGSLSLFPSPPPLLRYLSLLSRRDRSVLAHVVANHEHRTRRSKGSDAESEREGRSVGRKRDATGCSVLVSCSSSLSFSLSASALRDWISFHLGDAAILSVTSTSTSTSTPASASVSALTTSTSTSTSTSASTSTDVGNDDVSSLMFTVVWSSVSEGVAGHALFNGTHLTPMTSSIVLTVPKPNNTTVLDELALMLYESAHRMQ